ncbi:hypothetical protein CR513_48354, partial [Mucuna pruriens]
MRVKPSHQNLKQAEAVPAGKDLMEFLYAGNWRAERRKGTVTYRQGAPRKRQGTEKELQGRARFRTEQSFYENPYPECTCGFRSKLEIT